MTQDKKALGRMALRRPGEDDPAADAEALKQLSEQHGVPGIDLGQICIRLTDLEILPRELAERRLILPALVRDDRVFVAMVNPGDKKVLDEMEFVTGKRIFPYVALPHVLERVIQAAYDARTRGEDFYIGPSCPPAIQRKMGALPDDRDEDPAPLYAPSVAPPAPGAPEPDELSYNEIGKVDRELSVTGIEVPPPSPSTPPLAMTKKTILVVDDEADIRKILIRVLGGKGYRVLEAERGLDALRAVKAHMPDLILLDAMLPEVNGFEIARRIRGSQKYGHIPIIMVSAVYKGEKYAKDAMESYGVEAYLEKPFRIADVTQAVETAFARVDAAATEAAGEEPPPARLPSERPPKRDPNLLSAEAERRLEQGVAAWQSGDLDGAIRHLKAGLDIDPLAFRLHFHLGLLYGKRGLTYDAISELESAMAQNDQHFPTLKNLAVLYQRAGFKKKALTTWQKAALVAPDETTQQTIQSHIATLQ